MVNLRNLTKQIASIGPHIAQKPSLFTPTTMEHISGERPLAKRRSRNFRGEILAKLTLAMMPTAFSWSGSSVVAASSVGSSFCRTAFVTNTGLVSRQNSQSKRLISPLKSTIENNDVLFIVDNDQRPSEKGDASWQQVCRDKSLAAKLDVHPLTTHSHRPHIVGHRGSLYHELENTLQSFVTSHDLGCDAVELDVFLLKCGELVVFHGGGTDQNPGCLKDYMNIEGSILDYTASDARSLSFNPHHEEFGCGPDRIKYKHDMGLAYIPTLREVLIHLRDMTDLTVKIELKGPGTELPTLGLVEELGMVDRCHFASFDHTRIKRIRDMRPQLKADGTHVYRTGALFTDDLPDDFVDRAINAGASEVHLKYDTCTKSRINAIHAAGMDSMCWFRGPIGMKQDCADKYHDVGNEDESMYRTVMATGVRSMCINRPDRLVAMVGQRADRVLEALENIEVLLELDDAALARLVHEEHY